MGDALRLAGRARHGHADLPPGLSADAQRHPRAAAVPRSKTSLDARARGRARRRPHFGHLRLRAASRRRLSVRPRRLRHLHQRRPAGAGRAAAAGARQGRARAGAAFNASARLRRARRHCRRRRRPPVHQCARAHRRAHHRGLAPAHPADVSRLRSDPPRLCGRARTAGAAPRHLRLSRRRARRAREPGADHHYLGHPACDRHRHTGAPFAGRRGLGRGSGLPDDAPGAGGGWRRASSGRRRRAGPRRARRPAFRAKSPRRLHHPIAPISARHHAGDDPAARAPRLGARGGRLDHRGRLPQRIPLRRPAARRAARPR